MEQELAEVFARFRGERNEVIPLLQQVQGRLGFLPIEAMSAIAEFARVPEATVYGVATFYAQFKLTPSGRHIIRVCRGTACHVRGGPKILEEVRRVLGGIEPGATTEDLEYTLETVACVGGCAMAPTMVIDETTFGQMTTKKVQQIFAERAREG